MQDDDDKCSIQNSQLPALVQWLLKQNQVSASCKSHTLKEEQNSSCKIFNCFTFCYAQIAMYTSINILLLLCFFLNFLYLSTEMNFQCMFLAVMSAA